MLEKLKQNTQLIKPPGKKKCRSLALCLPLVLVTVEKNACLSHVPPDNRREDTRILIV